VPGLLCLFFFITVRHLLLVPDFHLALERIFHTTPRQRPFHSATGLPIGLLALGRLCVRVQMKLVPRHGIMMIRTTSFFGCRRGLQRTDRSNALPSETSPGLYPEKVRLRLFARYGSVRESLRSLPQPLKTALNGTPVKPLFRPCQNPSNPNNSMRSRSLPSFGPGLAAATPRAGLAVARILASCQSRTQHDNSAQNHTHTYAAIHYRLLLRLSRLLCELFAAAYRASPFSNTARSCSDRPFRPFSLLHPSASNLSPKGSLSTLHRCVPSRGAARAPPLPHERYCGQPYPLGASIIADEQIDLILRLRPSLTGKPERPCAPRCSVRRIESSASSVSAAKAPSHKRTWKRKSVSQLSAISRHRNYPGSCLSPTTLLELPLWRNKPREEQEVSGFRGMTGDGVKREKWKRNPKRRKLNC